MLCCSIPIKDHSTLPPHSTELCLMNPTLFLSFLYSVCYKSSDFFFCCYGFTFLTSGKNLSSNKILEGAQWIKQKKKTSHTILWWGQEGTPWNFYNEGIRIVSCVALWSTQVMSHFYLSILCIDISTSQTLMTLYESPRILLKYRLCFKRFRVEPESLYLLLLDFQLQVS